MTRIYASVIKPGSIYENYVLRAARNIVLKFYRLNGPIFKRRLHLARPKIGYAALQRMTVVQLNKFISKHLSNWQKLSENFQDHYRAYLNQNHLSYDRLRISLTMSTGNNHLSKFQAGFVWKTVFPLRAGSEGGPSMKPPTPPKKPPIRTAPRPVVRVEPRLSSAEKQQALKKELFAAVRKVYGPSIPDSQVMVALKYCRNNEQWKQLIQLRVVHFIRQAFAKFGYHRAASNPREARVFLNTLLQNWERASTRQPQPQVRHRPAPVPKKPVAPPASRITVAQKKTMVLAALLPLLRKKELATKLHEAEAFATGQTWQTVVALKIHIPFMKALKSQKHLKSLFPPGMSQMQQMAQAKTLFELFKPKK
jgi:hypothetical protein